MNKEEIMKEIEHIANCESYDTIGVKYLRLNIEKLFEENQQLKERMEYLERSNNRREDTIFEQRQKISDLEDNWNKLKECLKDVMNSSDGDDKDFVETILDIMQQIEQGSDSNE